MLVTTRRLTRTLKSDANGEVFCRSSCDVLRLDGSLHNFAHMHICSPVEGVEVVVEDNGAGVAEDELARLCEEGFRGKRQKSNPGTGLGLHIAKQMLDLLDGQLLLERVREGAGLRVRIQLRGIDEDEVQQGRRVYRKGKLKKRGSEKGAKR